MPMLHLWYDTSRQPSRHVADAFATISSVGQCLKSRLWVLSCGGADVPVTTILSALAGYSSPQPAPIGPGQPPHTRRLAGSRFFLPSRPPGRAYGARAAWRRPNPSPPNILSVSARAKYDRRGPRPCQPPAADSPVFAALAVRHRRHLRPYPGSPPRRCAPGSPASNPTPAPPPPPS